MGIVWSGTHWSSIMTRGSDRSACRWRRSCSERGYDVSIALVQTSCGLELLHRCLEEWRDLGYVSATLRAAARYLQIDGDAVEGIPNIVRQLLQLGGGVAITHGSSIAQIGIVRRSFHDRKIRMRHRAMFDGGVHVLRHEIARVVNVELAEQEFELLVVGLRERLASIPWHVPDLPLERSEGFLARLVEELFVRISRLALFLCMFVQPRVDLRAE